MTPARLTVADVGCWVIKSRTAPGELDPGWSPGEVRSLARCVRRSYRLDLMAPGQRSLLWLSGSRQPGVHAIGRLSGAAEPHPDPERVSEAEVRLDLTLLPEPVPRAVLLGDHVAARMEVLKMPAGSNPSYLSPDQLTALQELLAPGAAELAGW